MKKKKAGKRRGIGGIIGSMAKMARDTPGHVKRAWRDAQRDFNRERGLSEISVA